MNRKPKGIKKIKSQFTYTQTSSNSYHSSGTFFNNFDFEKRGNKAIFDRCLPPRKHILGTKGIELHTRRLFYSLLTMFRFDLHTHTYDNKRELAINSID